MGFDLRERGRAYDAHRRLGVIYAAFPGLAIFVLEGFIFNEFILLARIGICALFLRREIKVPGLIR